MSQPNDLKFHTQDSSRLSAPQAYNIMQDPKEYADIFLQNLWLLSPALKHMVPFYISTKQYDLIQTGDEKPILGEVEMAIVSSSLLNKMFQQIL